MTIILREKTLRAIKLVDSEWQIKNVKSGEGGD